MLTLGSFPGEFNKETIYRVLGKPQGLVQHPGLIKTQLLPVLGPREEGKEQLLEPKMRVMQRRLSGEELRPLEKGHHWPSVTLRRESQGNNYPDRTSIPLFHLSPGLPLG